MRVRKCFSGFLLIITCCHPFYAQADAAVLELREREVRDNIRALFDVRDMHIAPEAVSALMTFMRSIPSEHYHNLNKVKIGRFHKSPRGQTRNNQIILNVNDMASQEEFVAVFIHELGHIVDLGFLGGSETILTPFQQISWKTKRQLNSNATESDFVSRYAMSSPWEDFAESYAMYVIRGKTFDHWRRDNTALNRKFNFLKQKIFQQKDFLAADTAPILENRERTWDVTLNTFNLNQLLAVLNLRKKEREIASRTRHKSVARYQRAQTG